MRSTGRLVPKTFRRALTASVDSRAEIKSTCSFSGVTNSGRVWSKAPERDVRSLTLDAVQSQSLGNIQVTGSSTYGLSRALRYHTALNRTEPNRKIETDSSTSTSASSLPPPPPQHTHTHTLKKKKNYSSFDSGRECC